MSDAGEDDQPEVVRAGQYVAPALNRGAYHCPHCHVYAAQKFSHLNVVIPGQHLGTHIYQGLCFNCREVTYWFAGYTLNTTVEDPNAIMVIPTGSANAPDPHSDFPEDPKADYIEARSIVDRSPRGATALLRLAVQKLCKALGEPGQNINTDVASLVQKGLQPGVQEALDSLRVIGNNAVHPGQMDLRDDKDTAIALFGLLNFIVEQMIQRPKELQAIYSKLPPSAVAAIQQRDAPADRNP